MRGKGSTFSLNHKHLRKYFHKTSPSFPENKPPYITKRRLVSHKSAQKSAKAKRHVKKIKQEGRHISPIREETFKRQKRFTPHSFEKYLNNNLYFFSK